ncbi:hypothetical protein K435DRAFT_657536, partial [Dendrothele bispora CBS 962.96]
PILDKHGRVVAVLAGRPRSSDWDSLVKEGAEKIDRAREELSFTRKQTEHSRGDFPAISVGVAYGGGRTEPGNVRQSSAAALTVLTSLLAMHIFQSLSGFANCIFKAYALRTYTYYADCLGKIYSWKPELRRHFKTSVFGTCTVNFGPRTVSRRHRDGANLSFGWCAITALGNFNPNKGGHLILWDLGLVIRFPPGSTILIPSALITHSNIPVQKGETRYSFVQYSAAGLFRWVYNGFKTDAEWESTSTPGERAQREQERSRRWEDGVRMFSNWSECTP